MNLKNIISATLLFLVFSCRIALAQAKNTQSADSIDQANRRKINQELPYIKQATVAAKDSSIEIYARLGPGYKDYRIFGYAKPDTLSRRMILLSLFTADVKNNPFNCPFGAYYGTGGMRQDSTMQLKFLERKQHFIKATILKNHRRQATVFIRKRWIAFEKDD